MNLKKMFYNIKEKGENGKLVIRNSIFGMSGSIIGQVLAMLTSIVMGRVTGVDGVGTYTFAITISGILYLFLNLGIGGILHRNIARDVSVAEKHYANTLFIRLFFSLPVGMIVTALICLVVGDKDNLMLYIFACIYTCFTGIFSVVADGITATERFDVNFWFGIIQKVLNLITTFIALLLTKSILVMLVLNAIAFLFLIIAELLYVEKKICRIHIEFDRKFCKKLIKDATPTIFGAAAEYLSLKSDTVILSLMLGTSATGLYAISSNVYIAASFIPLAMAKAVTPTFNRLYARGDDVKKLIKKTIIYMLLSSVVLIIGIVILGKWGIIFLWGEQFEQSAIPLYILSFALLFMPLNRLFEYLLLGVDRQGYVMKCCIIGAVFNVLSNILLIPIVGINAAAITTVITELIVMTMEGLEFNRVIKK